MASLIDMLKGLKCFQKQIFLWEGLTLMGYSIISGMQPSPKVNSTCTTSCSGVTSSTCINDGLGGRDSSREKQPVRFKGFPELRHPCGKRFLVWLRAQLAVNLIRPAVVFVSKRFYRIISRKMRNPSCFKKLSGIL